MKKIIVTTLLIICAAASLSAQQQSINYYQVKTKGKFGVVNTAGKLTVPANYDVIKEWNDGVACAKVRDKYGKVSAGAINLQGVTVIPFIYKDLEYGGDGFYRDKSGTFTTLLDKTGKVVSQGKYYEILRFGDDGLAAANRNGLWGFVSASGVEVVPCKYEKVGAFYGGTAPVCLDGKWAFIDRDGALVTDYVYKDLVPVSERINMVRKKKYGLVDNAGNTVLSCVFDDIRKINDNFILVTIHGMYGLASPEGELLAPCEYDKVETLGDDSCVAIIKYGAYGLVEKSGDIQLDCKYVRVKEFSEGLAAVETGLKWGFVDTEGKQVIPCIYSFVSPFKNGQTVAKLNEIYAVMGASGEFKATGKFDMMDYQNTEYPRVRINGKWGYATKDGKPMIPCRYDAVEAFSEGLGAVEIRLKWGYMDPTGKLVIQCRYDDADIFLDGKAIVGVKGKYGVIDRTGKALVRTSYDLVTPIVGQR